MGAAHAGVSLLADSEDKAAACLGTCTSGVPTREALWNASVCSVLPRARHGRRHGGGGGGFGAAHGALQKGMRRVCELVGVKGVYVELPISPYTSLHLPIPPYISPISRPYLA